MSTFSYAQAAKGQLSTPPAPQSVTSQTASTVSNHNAEASAATGTSTVPNSIAPSTISSDQDAKDATTQSSTQAEPAKAGPEVTGQTGQSPESVQKTTPETSVAVAAAAPERKSTSDTTPERRAKGPSARSSDVSENRKSRKGKKAKTSDKETEQEQAAEKEKEPEPPKVQLSDAPIPSVNIWAQRAKEAQSKAPQPSPSRPSANTQDAKSKPAVSDNEGAGRLPGKGQKKEFTRDVNEHGPRRHAPRGSRNIEKNTTESLPSVADAASWPTPETAAVETKPQEASVKSTENDDNLEEKTDAGPKDKPKWVAIPFVPSAVFETPLPSRNPRGSKTGATRGGREAGPRNHHPTDRTQAGGAARPSGERSAEVINSVKASGPVAPVKRTSVDNISRDVRKISGPSKEVPNGSSATLANGTDESVKATLVDNKDNTNSQQQASDSPITEKQSRPDPSRESFTPTAKENAPHHATKSEKRAGRGRGGHTGPNGQGHRGHGAFSVNGQSFGGNHMNSRQNSYPGNVPMSYTGAQANGHPTRNSTSGAYFRGNGRSGRGSAMQATPTWHMDPAMQPMGAIPPQPYYYENSILPMLNKQLQYYFSVNNLLKDSYLRRCMDSQGYVFLDVILSFQRIQQLTNDVNLVRMACVSCPEIELVTGMEDHRDRIRRVKGWQEFVYPPGSRNEQVNFDDGPVNVWRHDQSMFMQPYPMVSPYQVESPGFYPPNGAPFPAYGNEDFQQYNMTNGVNDHAGHKETQLSADVPEFSPKGGSSASDAPAGKETQTNGINSINNASSKPYTNGVAGDAEVAAH